MLTHLPNGVSALRIALVPMLAWLTFRHDQARFSALLIVALASDVVDGALARALNVTSTLGARLDSIADTLLFFMAIVGVLVFYPPEVRAHAVAFAVVPSAWLAENATAFLRYGRLSSFHTYLSRAGAVAMGTFVVTLFLWELKPVLLHLATGLVLVATVEEFALMWLLPEWTRDVRGLYWVSRADRDTG